MEKQRPSWEEYFLQMARVTASRSSCLRAKVGAVIVSPRKKIISTGYNGAPHGVENCIERGVCYRVENKIPSGTRYETCRSLHAEQNAIIQAGEEQCVGATMYLYGHSFVCMLCKRFIVQSGITEVIIKKDENAPVEKVNPQDWIKEM